MSEAAPPVMGQEARQRAAQRAALRAGLRGGANAFAVVTAVGVAIGMIEYAVSGGAYRLWTWVKVGFLYVASFCTVSLHADVTGLDGATGELRYRFPLLAGTALALWLLARAGRAVVRRRVSAGATVAGLAGAVVSFALPVFLISLPATLRFPGVVHVDVHAVRWQAALYPVVIACAGVAAGAFLESRARIRPGIVAAVEGGWRAFAMALWFAFVGFLLLAAVKPASTGAYAREMRDEGRLGMLTVTHHALMLPAQSMWVLAPSMGGVTEASIGPDDTSSVTIRRAVLGRGAVAFGPARADPIVLGGGFYLFLLVPLVASVLGGRHAGRGASNTRGRVALGAGVGVVFAAMVGAGAWASGASVPIPAIGWGLVSIGVGMPSTVVVALVWGVGGGSLGVMTSRIGAQDPVDPAAG